MISVIVLAAGSATRFGGKVKKQYMLVENLPVLVKTVKAFCTFRDDFEIIVVCPKGDEDYVGSLVPGAKIVPGGDIRGASVIEGLKAATGDLVLVHDAARCFVDNDTIANVVGALEKGASAVIPCVSPTSTIRTRKETLDRSSLFEVQTPQGFKTELLRAAYKKAIEDGFSATDDAGVIEHYGLEVEIVQGSYQNIKITTKEDMPKDIRVGTGYDVHRLVAGRPLMLGLVNVPYDKGLLGHSDADVCAHAICDALLGAAGLRDIGYYFPDNSKDTEGMSGETIIKKTKQLITDAGFSIVNIDATIVAEKPKLSPYIDEMKERIAKALEIDPAAVGLKATTEEGLGITGNGEAITASAVASLK